MKKLSVLFAAVMMFMSFGVAKAQKIATVDVAAILNMMPEKIKADEQLKAFSTAKQAELEKLATPFQAEVQDFQQKAGSMTPQQRETKAAELEKKTTKSSANVSDCSKRFIRQTRCCLCTNRKKIKRCYYQSC